MSHEHDVTAHPRSEDDHVDGRSVVMVGAGALFVFTVASIAAGTYLHLRAGERPPLPLPPEVGQTKVAMVEQQLFDTRLRGARDRDARLARLGSSGWVDRAQGVTHIPIEAAMDLVVQGVRAAPGAPLVSPPMGPEFGGPPVPPEAVPGLVRPAPPVKRAPKGRRGSRP